MVPRQACRGPPVVSPCATLQGGASLRWCTRGTPAQRSVLCIFVGLWPQVLYLHSKGVTARHQAEPARTRVYQWRTAMSYFLIYHHRAMIRLLDDFDVVGARMHPVTLLHGPQ